MQKSVLVIGGTGYLGSQVIDQLLKMKVHVRALVRESSDHREIRLKGVEVYIGDLRQPESLKPALKNIDCVISTAIGYSGRKKGDTLNSVDNIGNKNLADAIKQAEVSRFVFTSILTAEKARSVPHFWQKKLIEDYLDQKEISYIALRPGAFLDQQPADDPYANGLKKGHLKVLGSTSAKWTNILSQDVARYLAIAAVDETIPLGKVDIGMEESMSAEMLVHYASEYQGSQIKISAIPWAVIGSIFSLVGIFNPKIKDLKKMFNYFFTGLYVADTTLQKQYFGEVPSVKESVFRYCQQIGLKERNG